MMRKGLISKRKILMDLNLAMKRRNKVLSRSFTNIFLHGSKRDLGFGLREYEFSCSNSPNPAVFSHKRLHNYFPCLGSVSEEPEMWWTHGVALRRIEYSPSPSPKISLFTSRELAPGEKRSLTPSPISIRIMDYSDEEEEQDVQQEENIVDGEAEEFIRRFYEQLQAQNRIALLEYQEREYQNMLA
jgi:hypothetical protein